METKQIIAIFAVIAVAAAACVGAAYAFSASLDNTDNSAGVTYWQLKVDESANGATATSDPDHKLYTGAFFNPLPFDTKTEYEKIKDTPEEWGQVVKIKALTVDNKIKDVDLSVLGWLTMEALVDGTADSHPEAAGEGKYYPFTIAIQDATKYNESYALYAAPVTLDANKKVSAVAGDVVLLAMDQATGKYTAVLKDVNVTAAFTVAIFAIPSSFDDLRELQKAAFVDAAGTQTTPKMTKSDVLQGAVFEFTLNAEAKADPTVASLAVKAPSETVRIHGIPAPTDTSYLAGFILTLTDSEGSQKLVAFDDTNLTIAAPSASDATKITFTYDGTTAQEQACTVYQEVKFMDGGKLYAMQEVNYKAKATAPTVPTKAGYQFSMWTLDASVETPTAFDFNTEIDEDKVLYAVWTPDVA